MWSFRIHPFTKQGKERVDRALTPKRACDISGCQHGGDYKAPKSRYDMQSYYWFCLDHVREYNANWDFFKGMNRAEIEHHMYKTVVWDRPTWRMTQSGFNEERARQKIYEHFTAGESVFGEFSGTDDGARQEAHINIQSIPHPAVEALAVMDLEPPIQWDEVKARYKTLAKKYHPDTNRGNKNAEEQFKKINLAYTILKLSYQHYISPDEKK